MSEPREWLCKICDTDFSDCKCFSVMLPKEILKEFRDEYDALKAECERLKWPLSEASKQVYRRRFHSIEECQDFYCGYSIKLTEERDRLREANKVLREELEFYAAFTLYPDGPIDGGQRAREAIKQADKLERGE